MTEEIAAPPEIPAPPTIEELKADCLAIDKNTLNQVLRGVMADFHVKKNTNFTRFRIAGQILPALAAAFKLPKPEKHFEVIVNSKGGIDIKGKSEWAKTLLNS